MSAYCALCNHELESYTHAEECPAGIMSDDDAEGKVGRLLKDAVHLRENLTKAEASVHEHKATERALRAENERLLVERHAMLDLFAEIAASSTDKYYRHRAERIHASMCADAARQSESDPPVKP